MSTKVSRPLMASSRMMPLLGPVAFMWFLSTTPDWKSEKGTSTPQRFGLDDVFVHLHIPKSGGSSFGKSLLQLNVEPPCVARENASATLQALNGRLQPGQFRCVRGDGRPWLLSRYSIGWPCGVHPSFDRLKACIPQRFHISESRLLYVTFIRDPVERFVSEFLHTSEGWSRWNDGYRETSSSVSIPSDFYCNGTLRPQEPSCDNQISNGFVRSHVIHYLSTGNASELVNYQESRNQSLWDFLACPSSYPHNRQTRMLAQKMPCRDEADHIANGEYERGMLTSAIETLRTIPYFGITDRRFQSERLFEWTFGVTFRNSEGTFEGRADKLGELISNRSRILIEAAEHLDVELWGHATRIFEHRIQACGAYCQVSNP